MWTRKMRPTCAMTKKNIYQEPPHGLQLKIPFLISSSVTMALGNGLQQPPNWGRRWHTGSLPSTLVQKSNFWELNFLGFFTLSFFLICQNANSKNLIFAPVCHRTFIVLSTTSTHTHIGQKKQVAYQDILT